MSDREHIKKAFLDVFPDIEKLVDGQVNKSKEAGLAVSVCEANILNTTDISDVKF
jgi:hypothetical protein